MIRFVIAGHRAVTTGDFKLDDIAGGAGRLDILVRCVNSAFFLSHSVRTDVELFLVLQGGTDAPKTVRFSGSEIRYLNPDERSTASLIRNALLKRPENDEIRSTPGVYISRRSFFDVINELKEISKIVYLKEDGTDVRDLTIPDDVTFVLGDDRDLTEAEEEAVMSCTPSKICLGPLSLHADHCMIVVLNETDRQRSTQLFTRPRINGIYGGDGKDTAA